MSNTHPWTESGIALLQTIQNYIDDNGGRGALASAMQDEWRPEYETCPESYTKIRAQVIDLYGKVGRPTISKMVGINESRVAAILKDLIEAGQVTAPRKSRKGVRYRKGKKIRERQERREKRVTVKREFFQMNYD